MSPPGLNYKLGVRVPAFAFYKDHFKLTIDISMRIITLEVKYFIKCQNFSKEQLISSRGDPKTKITQSRKRAKILAHNRKSHHPIETLIKSDRVVTWQVVQYSRSPTSKQLILPDLEPSLLRTDLLYRIQCSFQSQFICYSQSSCKRPPRKF